LSTPKKTFRTLRRHLTEAGINVEFDGTRVSADGRRIGLVIPRKSASRAEVVGATIYRHFPDLLLTAVAANLSGRGLPVSAIKGKHGIALVAGGRAVAIVGPTQARFAARAPLAANFLIAGMHWTALERVVRTSVARQKPLTPPSAEGDRPSRVVLELPAEVSADARELAQLATALIREDRTVTFGHIVEMRADNTTLRFSPVTDERGPVEAPFVFERPGATVAGALRLRSTRQVLALAVDDATDDEALLTDGWVKALVAFADLTCVPQNLATAPPVAAQRLHGHRRAGRSGPQAARSRQHGKVLFSDTLTPTVATNRLLASYVVGHRRRLKAGQRASDEARRAAEKVGITLRPRETWVRPFLRGAPDDSVLSFTWQPPAALAG